MRDVTDLLMTYREAMRHLWNTYFVREMSSLLECGALDKFEEIDRLLFSALVLDQLAPLHPAVNFRSEVWPFLRVVAQEDSDSLAMMLSDLITGPNRSWSDRTFIKLNPDTELAFIEFFDWDQYGFVSFPYIRLKILKFPSRPDLVGREALVDSSRCRVLFAQ
jgi:hypothetical protein